MAQDETLARRAVDAVRADVRALDARIGAAISGIV
jgi:hypothetical protein